MSEYNTNEPMMEMFIFETEKQIEQLEQYILSCEKESCFSSDVINEIFRIMHTIKGSAAMMMFHNISAVAHSIEDIFYFIREEKPKNINCSTLSDLVFEVVDFIKVELEKIKNNDYKDEEDSVLLNNLKEFLNELKTTNNSNTTCEKNFQEVKEQQYDIRQEKKVNADYDYIYKVILFFEDGCEMENVRSYAVIHNLEEYTDEIFYIPNDIIENEESVQIIRRDGFIIYFKSNAAYEKMNDFFNQIIFLKDFKLIQLENDDEFKQFYKNKNLILQENPTKIPGLNVYTPMESEHTEKENQIASSAQSIISVSVLKLDKLMDLVGEMVIAEAMVIQNPDLADLELDNFQKAARQLNKITSEIQDMVMAIRMVPLSATFLKMHRIVRDMSKKLNKEVELKIIGEETEVDKNIIEHISDPLMHLVRNSVDHGIEQSEHRIKNGKSRVGTVTLEAKNAGSDVLILIKDDGQGLSRDKILNKARENGLLYKDENDMSDKEIFNLILLPGFSTKDNITEFSGRGVGMDVVSKNIEAVGGTVSVESLLDKGTTIILKIPLTLAIIDGMNIKVGETCYTIPTTSIKESFRPKENDLITDPDGNEMIMVRGRCYPVLRLHKTFKVNTLITEFTNGIIIMVEQDEKTICIFADELVGQQQVVVKALPEYIKRFKKIKGLSGCTLLGDGSISLILDIAGLITL